MQLLDAGTLLVNAASGFTWRNWVAQSTEAVRRSRSIRSLGLSAGSRASSSAALPATMGAAIEVPPQVPQRPPGVVRGYFRLARITSISSMIRSIRAAID